MKTEKWEEIRKKLNEDPVLREQACNMVFEDIKRDMEAYEAFCVELNSLLERYSNRTQAAFLTKILHRYCIILAKKTSPFTDEEIKKIFANLTEYDLKEINSQNK